MNLDVVPQISEFFGMSTTTFVVILFVLGVRTRHLKQLECGKQPKMEVMLGSFPFSSLIR